MSYVNRWENVYQVSGSDVVIKDLAILIEGKSCHICKRPIGNEEFLDLSLTRSGVTLVHVSCDLASRRK